MSLKKYSFLKTSCPELFKLNSQEDPKTIRKKCQKDMRVTFCSSSFKRSLPPTFLCGTAWWPPACHKQNIHPKNGNRNKSKNIAPHFEMPVLSQGSAEPTQELSFPTRTPLVHITSSHKARCAEHQQPLTLEVLVPIGGQPLQSAHLHPCSYCH